MINIQKDLSFKNLTTFRIGGRIKYFVEVKSEEDINDALEFANENHLPIFILGGGSDFLANDKEFSGIVIKYISENYVIDGESITADAGMNWDTLVALAIENNLQGLEALSGIPGTVGASPIQNIGAYGQEVADTFYKLEAYELESGKLASFSKDECGFGYRESIFKSKKYWQKYLIVRVIFKLKKSTHAPINYASLRNILGESATLGEIREAVLKIRREKLEDPGEVGNAGSFFKNPIIDTDTKNKLEAKFPGILLFSYKEMYKVSAAWLIEKSGWKGKTLGGAGVSSKHSLILINKTGEAAAMDVFELSEMIIKDVFEKFGLELEREVQLINFPLT